MDTKKLRQKILDLAIRGKLVPQDPNDEPASVLLERIRAEKQQMVKDGKLKAKDIKNDTIIFKGEDNLHYEKFQDGTVKCIEDEIPFDVPEGWEFSRLQTIISLNSGKSIKVRQLEEEGKYPVYGGNGINGYYDDYNVYSNTIIIGRVGFYCGSIHLTSEKSWITDNALIVSVKTPVFIQDFFAEILRFLDLGKTSVSTAQPVVSGKGILPLIIPVPPIAEQERIILKFQEMISEVDKIEHDKDSLSDITNITKAKILDLAIRGKLVPQNPNDEPASILLERIRKEKIELIKQGKMKRDKKESIIYKGDDNSYY
ncbi:MAG: restriction endonuclease subunit S, partial [Eubacterium sp.]|nr:restriction endonuclease subunit S [Eubacterium sp.]